MNEVTKIHLGRQAFTISVEAHRELKAYLAAIEKQVSDNDVAGEVELRMTELLAERGVTGDKVILPADVDFLKQQLGNPKDFKEDEADDMETPADKPADGKRLFRDTDNAMLAGVAAGLSKYLGIDAPFIRLLFIIGIFTGGWGILIYVVLWLVVPEAKTSSDRLQMAGKPVTIDSLKEVVERADVKGAARRANNSLAGPVNTFFRILLKVIGLAFIIFGVAALIGLVGAETYVLLHGGSVFQPNLFPVGLREQLLLNITIGVTAIIALFIVLFGMAMFMRRWPIRAWITGVLIGLMLIGMTTGGALAADVWPTVRDRYNANEHTSVRFVKPFSQVNAIGPGVDINFQTSDKYSVSLRYFGHPNLRTIKTTVVNGTLVIDSQQFDSHLECQSLCIPDTYNMSITVSSPNAPQIVTPDEPPAPPFPSGVQKVRVSQP